MKQPIRLGLISYPSPHEDERGVTSMHSRRIEVVDKETGRPVRGHSGWLWIDGKALLAPSENPLFTPDHVEPGKDYLVLVYEVPEMESLDKDPYK